MNIIKNREIGGERPLFESHDLTLDNVKITAGESALKECSNITAIHCRFEGKYPFWHVHRFVIKDCLFTQEARSALWYSDHLNMQDTIINSPKMFREMKKLELTNVQISNGDETFWNCRGIILKNVILKDGTYPFMHSSNIKVDGLKTDSKYIFQYVKNAEIHHAHITTKDAFWEAENVTVYDSYLNSEYLGWHSKNLKLIRCKITGTQPLCYADNLLLKDCSFEPDADLAFEYSNLNADIKGNITSIKNPTSGSIEADKISQIILDKNIKAPANCLIKERSKYKNT